MTILIADDHETNRKLARVILRAKGYQIVEAKNGQEAFQWLNAVTSPAVALIDWEMPLIDGAEVCRRVRQNTTLPPLFLILLTVKDTEEDIAKGYAAGANDYLTKPFNHVKLIERVKIGFEFLEKKKKG